MAAAVAAVLSPPGRSVVHSLRQAVGVKQAEPALFSLPARGQLLVSGRGGAWLVPPTGRSVGSGTTATPLLAARPLLVAARGRTSSPRSIPRASVRWTLARPTPRFPAWTGTRADTRIAYVSGGRLRIVAGDGTGDREIGRAATGRACVAARRRGAFSRTADGRSAVVYDEAAGRVLRRLSACADEAGLVVGRPPAARLHAAQDPGLRRRQGRQADDPSDATFDRDAAFAANTREAFAVRAAGNGSSVFSLANGRTLFRGTGGLRPHRVVAERPLAAGEAGRPQTSGSSSGTGIIEDRGRRGSRPSRRVPRVEDWCCAR